MGLSLYLKGDKVCRDLLSLKRKELAFVLGYYYSDYDLSSLVHPLSKYVNSFQYFVIQNYKKVKTVEELAQLVDIPLVHSVVSSITSFMNLFMNGCWRDVKRAFWTT